MKNETSGNGELQRIAKLKEKKELTEKRRNKWEQRELVMDRRE